LRRLQGRPKDGRGRLASGRGTERLRDGPGTTFAFQHDVRRHPDGIITIFNNGNVTREEQSRGIMVEIDEDAMSASLARVHPP
jgi:hypothetical protein